jgi:hypothetical protein
VSAAETGTRGSRPGELHRRRVLLVAESAGLAAVLNHLLDPADRLSRIGTLRELADSRALEYADVVVLDQPAKDQAAAVSQVRRRYLGPLVVLVARGEDTGGLRLDAADTLLARPFSAEDLGAALAPPGGPRTTGPWTTRSPEPGDWLRSLTGGPGTEPGWSGTGPFGAAGGRPAQVSPDAAAILRAAERKAAARQAPVRVAPARPRQMGLIDRVRRVLLTLTQGWQARRRVRVAGFSAFALVAFTAAFALAAQGHCGPGCDALGTGFSPAPTITVSKSRAPSTTGPKRFATTSGTGSPGTGAFRGNSAGRLASTTTADRLATTTTSKPSSGGGPSTITPSTRPPTSQPTTTTQPPATPTTTTPPTTAGP